MSSIGEFIDPQRSAELGRQARARGAAWIHLDPKAVESAYNRLPFLVEHRLAEHPLFGTPGPIFELCRRLPPAQCKVRYGVVPPDTDFDKSLAEYNRGLTLEDAIEHFEERQAYIAIYNPERDPQYREAIEGFLGEIVSRTGHIDPDLNWYSTYIFLTAQGSLTPYHMDREMNFRLQACGTKTVRLWDPAVEGIMTEAQKNELLAFVNDLRPSYKPSFEAKAMVFDLKPGLGVHHPFIAPHLVHTGPKLSISLAITFRTRGSDIWTDAHAFNYHARRFGIRPSPVRRSDTVDRIKAGMIRAVRKVKRAMK